MIQRFRQALATLRRGRLETDPLVKVAGMPTRREADVCAEALYHQGIRASLRQDSARVGSFEVWVRASEEPRARLILGLSGHSVIRLPRQRGAKEKR